MAGAPEIGPETEEKGIVRDMEQSVLQRHRLTRGSQSPTCVMHAWQGKVAALRIASLSGAIAAQVRILFKGCLAWVLHCSYVLPGWTR